MEQSTPELHKSHLHVLVVSSFTRLLTAGLGHDYGADPCFLESRAYFSREARIDLWDLEDVFRGRFELQHGWTRAAMGSVSIHFLHGLEHVGGYYFLGISEGSFV